MAHRDMLQRLYRAGIARVGGRPVVRQALERDPPDGPVRILAVGKAAAAMAQGAVDSVDEHIRDGLIILPAGQSGGAVVEDRRFRVLESAHPVPDAGSLAAGEAALEWVDGTPDDALLLVLLSGGASSLMEALPEGCTEAELAALNRWFFGQHLPIDRINAVRRRISRVKGGRLGARLRGRAARVCLVSDVPGDDPAVVGSGPFHGQGDAAEPLPEGVPEWVVAAAERVPAAPATDDAALAGVRHEVLATNRDAVEAVVAAARSMGWPAQAMEAPLEGDALAAGEAIARDLMDADRGVRVWGGETTVALPDAPGAGGRCQALALTAASCLEGQEGVWVLAAGTDGRDGPGHAAGALIDAQTCFRGRQEGLDPDACLEAADSGRFLAASGDLLRAAPTGTNVMDLVIALRDPGERPSRPDNTGP